MEARIAMLKERFRIPHETMLHCRVLFSGQQRAKAGLSHLQKTDLNEFLHHAITILNQSNARLNYSISHIDYWREILGGDSLEMYGETKASTELVPVNLDPKGILGLLAQSCFAVPSDGSHGPSAELCEIYTAEDPTKISFLGEKRNRADRWYSGFSDIGAPSGQVFRLEPKIIKAIDSPILQLADIAAYICSHAASDDPKDHVSFREMLGRVRYWSRAVGVGEGSKR
jgi:hypothetical protein